MKTSLFCTLQTRISEAMLEAEGGWGKYPKQGTRAREREIRVRVPKCPLPRYDSLPPDIDYNA